MKVFISWSGPRSGLLAKALSEWIHDVIQSVECFYSSEDIRAGQRWNNEINSWLSDTDFGILCVTPENSTAPWLNFEAGALAKRINDDARVVPVALGFSPASLDEPLKQFNGIRADKPGLTRMMQSIAEVASTSLDVQRSVDRWWPDLEEKLNAIPASEAAVDVPKEPEVPEMFSDIMSSMRGLAHDVRNLRLTPTSRVTSAEYAQIASVLAENEPLREDVMEGNPRAVRFLRDEVRRGLRRRAEELDAVRASRARLPLMDEDDDSDSDS